MASDFDALVQAARAYAAKHLRGIKPAERDEAVSEHLYDNHGIEDEKLLRGVLAEAFNMRAQVAQTRAAEADAAKKPEKLSRATRKPPDDSLITAPYRFITLPDEVVLPEHGNGGLHDKPLPDGFCGEITVDWVAETPLLIGSAKTDTAQAAVEPLSIGLAKHFTIPGATLRGLLRAACEIVAYGKLGSANLHHRYGLREFQHPHYAEESGVTDAKKVQAGFLTARNGVFKITPALKWARVEISTIPGAGENWSGLSLEKKYEHLGICVGGRYNFSKRHDFVSAGDGVMKPEAGGTPGLYVVSDKLPGSGKKRYEYCIIPDPSAKAVPVDEDRAKLFQTLASTPNKNKLEPMGTWKILKPVAENSEIPVFYVGTLAPGQQADFFFGLTRLFKIPHRMTVGDILARQDKHLPTGKWAGDELTGYAPDFVEHLFGYVVEAEDLKLFAKKQSVKPSAVARKGRLAFGFAMLDKATPAQVSSPVEVIQMAPRASFAPFYLKADGPKDYSAGDARLAGRKAYFPRYTKPTPVGVLNDIAQLGAAQKQAVVDASKGKPLKGDVLSKLKFLVPRAAEPLRFTGAIRFHNVTAAELGAILFVLTHNEDATKTRRFMLGRAKPFGAGQMRVDRITLTATANSGAAATGGLTPFIVEFKKYMHGKIPDFPNVPAVQEWLAMCSPGTGEDLAQKGKLAYQPLGSFKILREQTQALRPPADDPLPQARLLPAPGG